MRRMKQRALATDEQLVSWSAAGDEEAFTTLYRRRQASVFRYAFHMCGRDDVAEEVTQDVFVTLIREPGRFDMRRGSVLSYLLGIARNHVLRVLEQDRSYLPVSDDDATEPAGYEVDVLEQLTRDETIAAVRRAILTLPPVYREAVVL